MDDGGTWGFNILFCLLWYMFKIIHKNIFKKTEIPGFPQDFALAG